MPTNDRELALAEWVSQKINLPQALPLTSIASDAGFRRYFRFDPSIRLLAVDAPPETEDTHQFVALARYLRGQGVHTPEIVAADANTGFLLVEDFGDRLLHGELSAETADRLYRLTFNTLLSLQKCQDLPDLIPRYDRALLRRELEIFKEWFVARLLKHALSERDAIMLDALFTTLEDAALTQPQTLVHRDFHSRNLILRTESELGVIDFQGALWGGVTYDLASLLRDCYVRWPAATVKAWTLEYRQMAIDIGIIPEVDEQQFLRWFDYLGLQRHIKVLGIFARLHLRDGKSGYLKDLPLVIRYILEVAEQYLELESFAIWFKNSVLPQAKNQLWYSDYLKAGE